MSRDPDALNVEKWAANGDVSTPESEGLDRATGWPASYSQAGGDVPTRELFNQLFREITALLVEINTRGGILAWDSSIFYIHPALVMGSNGKPYISVADSTGVDPVTDTSNSSWTLLEDFIAPNASTAVKGKVELATNAETQAGTDAGRAVTPAGLASRTASTTRAGMVERATQAEADAGTDTERYMTPALVKRRIDEEAPADASTTVKGKVELATNAEVQTGTDTERAVTPAGLASRYGHHYQGRPSRKGYHRRG